MSVSSIYNVGSSGPTSRTAFFRSVFGGFGDPTIFKIFVPSPKLPAADGDSGSSVMFLLQTVQTSAAYDPPSASRNMLQRITRPQHTGTQIEAFSAGIRPLAPKFRPDYTLVFLPRGSAAYIILWCISPAPRLRRDSSHFFLASPHPAAPPGQRRKRTRLPASTRACSRRIRRKRSHHRPDRPAQGQTRTRPIQRCGCVGRPIRPPSRRTSHRCAQRHRPHCPRGSSPRLGRLQSSSLVRPAPRCPERY